MHHVTGSIPERPTTVAVVGACSLFNALSEGERDAIVRESVVAYADRGEYIWMAGSEAQFVGVGGVGFIKMTRTTPNGAEVVVELLGPGQCFGLLVALEGRAFPLSAVAVTPSWYLKVRVGSLQRIYAENEHFKDYIVRSIGPRLRKAHEMMARLSTGKIEQRLATVLTILMDSYGEKVDGGVRLTVPLTRQDLAEMAGTTVETSIRVMSRWQKQGIIDTDRQVITITNPALLSHALIN